MPTGTVKWFNSQKGYGFIQPQGGGKDVFVHISAVERAGLSSLNEAQAIEFELASNRGKTSAANSEGSPLIQGRSFALAPIAFDAPGLATTNSLPN